MLKKETFLKGINILMKTYLNWKFDITDDLQIQIWYNQFKNLQDNLYIEIINKYISCNKFPPNCPYDLIETLKIAIEENKLSSDGAWNKVLELVREYGFKYNADKIYESVKEDEILKKTIEYFERELENLKSDDQYVAERFKKAYEMNLKRKIENESRVLLGKKDLSKLLEFDKMLQIETKGEN